MDIYRRLFRPQRDLFRHISLDEPIDVRTGIGVLTSATDEQLKQHLPQVFTAYHETGLKNTTHGVHDLMRLLPRLARARVKTGDEITDSMLQWMELHQVVDDSFDFNNYRLHLPEFGFTSEQSHSIEQTVYYNDASFGRTPTHGYITFLSILNMHTISPGSALAAHNERGIVDFGRYHPEKLAKQIESNPQKRMRINVCGHADYNGVMANEINILDSFSEALGGDPVYYSEAGDTDSFTDIMNGLAGIGVTAQTVTIQGHGTTNSIRLGTNNNKGSFITHENVDEVGLSIRKVMPEGGTIILSSCSTGGGSDSIAYYLAKASSCIVNAPTVDTVLNKIVKGKKGPRAEYEKGQTMVFEP